MDNDLLIDLLARCALKDQSAFEQLYDKTAAYLNGVAYRIVGSHETSNDVLQEAYVQIWERASTYMPAKANPLTWMCSIIRYRAIDRIRQEQRHGHRPSADEEEDILRNMIGGESQDDVQHKFSLNAHLKQCLDMMDENFRTSIQLAYLYGYSREELAETLNANINTVKSWLRRGAANLKKCLEKRMGADSHDR